VPRYHLPLEGVTQLHADIGWMLGTLIAATVISLQFTGAPARARRLGWVLLGLTGLQGVIGYSQYFSGLPAGLVWVHVAGSVLIWITALLLMFATRYRGPVADTAGVPGALAEPVPAES
jgi:cytochrome c oxidase assembly protein subunit 15